MNRFSSRSALEKPSDIDELACSVVLGNLEGERHTGRLHAISASSNEGPHIRLRYPVPHHAACIEVRSFAHRLAGCIVVQECKYSICDSGWVFEGDQRSAPIAQEFGGVPVWSRDDRLPGAQSIPAVEATGWVSLARMILTSFRTSEDALGIASGCSVSNLRRAHERTSQAP